MKPGRTAHLDGQNLCVMQISARWEMEVGGAGGEQRSEYQCKRVNNAGVQNFAGPSVSTDVATQHAGSQLQLAWCKL